MHKSKELPTPNIRRDIAEITDKAKRLLKVVDFDNIKPGQQTHAASLLSALSPFVGDSGSRVVQDLYTVVTYGPSSIPFDTISS